MYHKNYFYDHVYMNVVIKRQNNTHVNVIIHKCYNIYIEVNMWKCRKVGMWKSGELWGSSA
jgi:hypothetical protein